LIFSDATVIFELNKKEKVLSTELCFRNHHFK
jgi:hypothetical protein